MARVTATILGCGSSGGVPRLGGHWGDCDPANPKNARRRCSMLLTRQGPGKRRQSWEANPHWVTVSLHEKGGRVPQYLTLRGAGREVELGAFLSEDERVVLQREVTDMLARSR